MSMLTCFARLLLRTRRPSVVSTALTVCNRSRAPKAAMKRRLETATAAEFSARVYLSWRTAGKG